MEAYTITKSIVECYKIRHTKSFYWADITIDASEGKGRIQIASDFGDYQYYWGACGGPFKEFLAKIGIDYTAGKFGCDRWFDLEATIRMYKSQILQDRRIDCLEEKQAREIFNAIKDIESNCSYSIHSFQHEAQQHDVFMKHWDYCPDVHYSISPQFRNFWKEIWPILLNEFRRETEELLKTK